MTNNKDMDYKELYNKALEKAKFYYNNCPSNPEKNKLEGMFPVLKESEDEKIRKALIEVFKKKLERGYEWVEYGIPNRSVLDWLEKQKEQKPIISAEESLGISQEEYSEIVDECIYGEQKAQKPAEKPKIYDSMDDLTCPSTIAEIEIAPAIPVSSALPLEAAAFTSSVSSYALTTTSP
jgi:hypothetical protein